MYIAYSALKTTITKPSAGVDNLFAAKHNRHRYRGYQAACKKYEQEIIAIQEYLPGWKPAFK